TIIRRVGDFTPNGAALETMLKLMQGYGLEVVIESVLYLMILGLITTTVAAICFPKRRMGT
ncbi:MAG: ABC transporter permease, partial [Caldibacillus sp.]